MGAEPLFLPYIRDADYAVRSPWHIPERRLLDYLIVSIQSGECAFTVNDHVHRLHTGSLCLVQPGERVELRGLTPTVTPYLHFDAFYNVRRQESFATRPGQLDLSAYRDFLQPRLETLGVRIPTILDTSALADAGNRVLKIVRLWQGRDPLSQLEAAHQLSDLLLALLKTYGKGQSAALPPPTLGWIPSYLSTHLGDPIRVGDLARRAHLSPSRFQAVFKDVFGTSPARYLMSLRVRHACELLEATDWTLAHIANLCGFADVHHFAKAFKHHTHQTPGAHRRNTRKQAQIS